MGLRDHELSPGPVMQRADLADLPPLLQ